nr:hypothetical protein [Tanacetum cinerariifolium]
MWMLVRGVEDKLEHVTTALQEMATMNQGVNENDFVGRSMNDFLNIYGTVKEYYNAFKSRDGIILLEQWYEVEVFICGLPWEIKNNVRLFKPNNLSAAYLLAVLEEVNYNLRKKNSHQPLFSSTKCNESKEVEKYSNKLLVFDDDCKGTNSRDELKVGEMDDKSNSKEVEKGSIDSMGYEECFEKNVNVKANNTLHPASLLLLVFF